MDRSLQVDRHQGLRSLNYTYRREASSHSELSDKLEDYNGRSPGGRPLSLGMIPSEQRKANGDPADAEDCLHKPPKGPVNGQSSPQQTLQEDKGDIAGSNGNRLPQQNRPFTTPPSTQEHIPKLDDLGRRRSKSIGVGPRDSRIAALSVQLRTRLSHAAARVEKKRQSQTTQFLPPAGFLQSNTSTPLLSTEPLPRLGQPLSALEIDNQRLAANGSPSGTTVSAPDAPAASSLYPPEALLRPSSGGIARALYPPTQPDPHKQFGVSSPREPTPLGLASPVDLVSSRSNSQRRRPNPNNVSDNPRYTPFLIHGRSRSQHELSIDPEVTLVPETPPLRPSNLNTSAPYNGLSENSQNSSMEQDAIETLLFMSSPGTSGYHSNSQNSLHDQDLMNIDRSASQSVQWPVNTGGSRSGSRKRRTRNLETQAGDAIDQMLDQMNSDSDDDADYTSNRANVT
ncbi:hypothetical protein BJX70DRAFT_324624 [Aspergillus crustosus]